MSCVVFAYHDIGYVCLQSLIEMGASIRAVFTHEDDPSETRWFRSVRALAEHHHIPVFTAVPRGPQWTSRLREWNPDLIFSFHYRRLLPDAVLETARVGAVNLHTSLLPRFRGRCPVNWVLVRGEQETGVTLHHMVREADAGDIVEQQRVPIDTEDTALTLYRKLTGAASALLRSAYPKLRDGSAPRVPQDPSLATYFRGRTAADGQFDWQSSGQDIYNLVRAVTHPFPGAFTVAPTKFYIWRCSLISGSSVPAATPGQVLSATDHLVVATGDLPLRLNRVQAEGGVEESGIDWAARLGVREGDTLT